MLRTSTVLGRLSTCVDVTLVRQRTSLLHTFPTGHIPHTYTHTHTEGDTHTHTYIERERETVNDLIPSHNNRCSLRISTYHIMQNLV